MNSMNFNRFQMKTSNINLSLFFLLLFFTLFPSLYVSLVRSFGSLSWLWKEKSGKKRWKTTSWKQKSSLIYGGTGCNFEQFYLILCIVYNCPLAILLSAIHLNINHWRFSLGVCFFFGNFSLGKLLMQYLIILDKLKYHRLTGVGTVEPRAYPKNKRIYVKRSCANRAHRSTYRLSWNNWWQNALEREMCNGFGLGSEKRLV